MKTAFLIAGFSMNRTAADERYDGLRKAIARKGYKVIPVPFVWNYTTVARYADKFVAFYDQHKSDYNVVIGNSYGAMAAFLAAPRTMPDKLLLCSLSPFFKEDTAKTTEAYRLKTFGKKRNDAMAHLSAKQIAKAVNRTGTKVVMLYGEEEKTLYPHLVERVKSTAKDLTNAELVEIPGAPHPFHEPVYVRGIELTLTK